MLNSGYTVMDKTYMVSVLIYKYIIITCNVYLEGNFRQYEKVQQGTYFKMRVRNELSEEVNLNGDSKDERESVG